MRLGAPELLIILAVVLVLFGGQRVPQLGAALGQAIRNFKRGFNGDDAPGQEGQNGRASLPNTSGPAQVAPNANERTRTP